MSGYLAKFNDDKYIANAMIVSGCYDLEITHSELEKKINSFINGSATKNAKLTLAK